MMKLSLPPNIPQLVALQDSQGDYDPDAGQVHYLTTDGRDLILNTSDATRLNLLDLQPGETLWITKRVMEGQLPYIELTLSPATEKERASAEAEAVPVAPLAVPARKRATRVREMPPTQPAAQPRLFDQRGTGTYGPAPRMQPAPATRPVPAPPIPFNQAFIEAVKIVRDGLKEAGVQWGDGPQQDAVSTILIGALQRNWVGPWERPDVV